MVIMAGMLPGVECARRRRRLLRQAGTAEAPPPCGTRRPSLSGHDHAHLASSSSKLNSNVSQQRRGSVCKNTTTPTTTTPTLTLDSNAREAKERLDQKLRSQRESVVKRHHSAGSLRIPGSAGDGEQSPTSALQREVFLKKRGGSGGGGGGRRRWFSWGGLGRRAAEQPECAVCLEELRAGDVLVHLPCGHRFHWRCAVPWVQAASRCPLCRAAVDDEPATASHRGGAGASAGG